MQWNIDLFHIIDRINLSFHLVSNLPYVYELKWIPSTGNEICYAVFSLSFNQYKVFGLFCEEKTVFCTHISYVYFIPDKNVFTRTGRSIKIFLSLNQRKKWLWPCGILQMKRVNIKGIFLKSPGNDATSDGNWKDFLV